MCKEYHISEQTARAIRVRMAQKDILTQSDLAQRIGVAPQYLNDILRGRRLGTAARKAIATLLDLDEADLFPRPAIVTEVTHSE